MAEQSTTGRLRAFVAQNRGPLAAAGIGGAALLAFIQSRRGAGGSSGGSVPAGGQVIQPAYGAAGYYDSTATDLYNAITPQLQGLQQQLTELKLQPGPVSSSQDLEQGFYGVGYGPLTPEFWAAGRQDDPIESLSGDKYAWLPSGEAVRAAQATGQQTYYQPAPGIFAPTTGLKPDQWKNTPIFVKG